MTTAAEQNEIAIDFCFVLALLAVFALAVMSPDLFPVEELAWIKWVFLLGVIPYVILRRKLEPATAPSLISKLLGLFLIVGGITTVNNYENFTDAITRYCSFGVLYLIACWFPVPVDPRKRLALWTTVLVALSAAVVIPSIAPLVPNPYLELQFTNGRLRGVTGNANTLGNYAAMLLVAGLATGLCGRGILRIILMALMPVCIIALLMTQSRAAMFSAAVAMLGVIVAARKWQVLLAYLVVAAFALTPTWILTAVLPADIVDQLILREMDLATREYVWQRQIDAWLQKPFLGHGFEVHSEDDITGRTGAEGSYTDLLAAVGVLGAAPLFAAFAYGVYRLLRWARASLDDRWVQPTFPYPLVTLGVMLVILVNSIGEGFLAAVGCTQAIYTWAILGAAGELSEPRA